MLPFGGQKFPWSEKIIQYTLNQGVNVVFYKNVMLYVNMFKSNVLPS